MRLSKQELRAVWERDRKTERRRLAVMLLITLAVFLFCMCWRYNAYYFDEKFVPVAYFKSLLLALKLLPARLAGNTDAGQKEIDAIGSILYLGAIARLRITAMSLVSGAALSVAGAIFQTAYRNPMASPNMIGATAGVQLGNVLVVMLYSGAAFEHIYLRYEFCYGMTILWVGVVLLLGKLAGDKRENYSILEMIMAGSIVSQMLNVVTMYIMYNLEDEDLLLYQEINMGTYLQTDAVSMTIFFIVMGAALLPVLTARYRLNAIGMDKMETVSLGINAGPLRIVGQLCGAAMVTCAMIHCGSVGMVSLVLPYIVRKVVGADFRAVVVYSALGGGILLMLCRLVTSFILIADAPIPVTFILNLVLMPAFMVILAKRRSVYT